MCLVAFALLAALTNATETLIAGSGLNRVSLKHSKFPFPLHHGDQVPRSINGLLSVLSAA